MEKVEHLNEERYQKTEKKISIAAIIILIIGLSIGGFLIFNGVVKPNTAKLEKLEKELTEKREELVNKGIVYNPMSKYTDGEEYDLKIITDALDPSFDHCSFSEYKNNTITKDYCSVKNSTGEFASTASIMFGVFICIATCMISFAVFMASKRRKILAFHAQQIMPVAQEGIEKMAPTIGKAGASVAKEMAPVYGDIAKEISKGIKEGLKESKESEE